jgi:malonyl-CoA O-methyltransferase
MHDVGDALVRAGFADPVLDVERYTLWYKDLQGLARDLQACGTRNASPDRRKGLTPPHTFAAVEAGYEGHRREGRLPATYEVVFGQAWTPADISRRVAGEQSVSLDELRRELATRRK